MRNPSWRKPAHPRRRQSRPGTPRRRRKPDMSTPNLANILSSFFTLRSTVKDLSISLQRLEKIMDHTYQMFELASNLLDKRSFPRRRPPLRLIKPSREEEEEIPDLNLPALEKEGPNGENPLFKLLEQIDITKIIQIIQSPVVQHFLSNLAQAKTSETPRRKQKQG